MTIPNPTSLAFTSFISQDQINTRIEQLADLIAQDYADKQVIFLCVLKGSFIFAADLLRAVWKSQHKFGLATDGVRCEFITLSSYGDNQLSSGTVQLINNNHSLNVKDQHVIIVEDIVDTGLTMNWLRSYLQQLGASTVKLSSLLYKPDKVLHDTKIDYLGFSIGNEYVIGYGLDAAQKYRHIPFLAINSSE